MSEDPSFTTDKTDETEYEIEFPPKEYAQVDIKHDPDVGMFYSKFPLIPSVVLVNVNLSK